jgi:RNA polymerase sigma-70 factor, ECF subfamily
MLRLVRNLGVGGAKAPPSTTSPSRPARESRQADELAQVAAAAAQGERDAVHALLVALAPHLLRTVRSVLGRDSSDVDDVAQEASLVVLGALPGFRGEGSVVRFAMRTAVLVAMNARRKRVATKRGGGLVAHSANLDELAASPDSPEQRVASARAATAVRELLSTLPAAQAEALALHCIAGCTLAEIAAATGAPQETVKSRLRLARQALRQTLERAPGLIELLEGDT